MSYKEALRKVWGNKNLKEMEDSAKVKVKPFVPSILDAKYKSTHSEINSLLVRIKELKEGDVKPSKKVMSELNQVKSDLYDLLFKLENGKGDLDSGLTDYENLNTAIDISRTIMSGLNKRIDKAALKFLQARLKHLEKLNEEKLPEVDKAAMEEKSLYLNATDAAREMKAYQDVQLSELQGNTSLAQQTYFHHYTSNHEKTVVLYNLQLTLDNINEVFNETALALNTTLAKAVNFTYEFIGKNYSPIETGGVFSGLSKLVAPLVSLLKPNSTKTASNETNPPVVLEDLASPGGTEKKEPVYTEFSKNIKYVQSILKFKKFVVANKDEIATNFEKVKQDYISAALEVNGLIEEHDIKNSCKTAKNPAKNDYCSLPALGINTADELEVEFDNIITNEIEVKNVCNKKQVLFQAPVDADAHKAYWSAFEAGENPYAKFQAECQVKEFADANQELCGLKTQKDWDAYFPKCDWEI